MAYDPTDPADVAAVKALVDAAAVKVAADHAPTLAALATARDAATARADALAAEVQAAKDAAALAVADATSTKAERDALKTRADALEAAEQARATATDKALVAALPEAVRALVPAGLAGEALATWATTARAAFVVTPVDGRNGGDGGVAVATVEMREWATSKGYGGSDAQIIAAYNKIGPGKPRLKLAI